MMKRISFLVMVTGFFCAGPVWAAESPVGKWSTIDEKTGNSERSTPVVKRVE